jgi:hypothetical protein
VRADILANEDFQDGTAHWDGDLRDVVPSTDENSPGLGVQMKDGWIKLYQTFNSHAVSLDLTITYRLSSDFAFTSPPPTTPLPNFPPGKFLCAVQNGRIVAVPIIIHPGNWGFALEDPEEHLETTGEITPRIGITDPQTSTFHIPLLMRHEEKQLYLIFPKGTGILTLLHVALTPSDVPFTEHLPDGIPKQNP